MKASLIAAVGLLAAAPASAACHKYSHWAYPWPQRCGVQLASRTPAREDPRPDPPLPPVHPLNFVAPAIEPPPEEWNEDALRAFAIQKLREKMERK